MPYLCEAIISVLSRWFPRETAFVGTYLVYDVVALVFSFSLLYCWLLRWHPKPLAVLGTLFACAGAPVAYWHHYFQPWSLLELGLFTAGLMSVLARRHEVLAMLVILYTLLRETGVMLVFAYGIMYASEGEERHRREAWVWTAALAALWGVVYFGLRGWLGVAPHAESIARIASLNFSLNNLLKFALYLPLMFGGFLVLAKHGFRQAPPALRRLTYVGVPYLMVMAVWAIWSEVRVFLPLYSLVLPLGLYAVQDWLGISSAASENA
ncbi:MAG: hypothetical protein RMK45_01440 [Armatimonadota bacterium]|nr:hypothetical protein [Armatimonadota bacterium]